MRFSPATFNFRPSFYSSVGTAVHRLNHLGTKLNLVLTSHKFMIKSFSLEKLTSQEEMSISVGDENELKFPNHQRLHFNVHQHCGLQHYCREALVNLSLLKYSLFGFSDT